MKLIKLPIKTRKQEKRIENYSSTSLINIGAKILNKIFKNSLICKINYTSLPSSAQDYKDELVLDKLLM